MSGSSGELRQQIGEILATVRGLERQQSDTSRAVERAVDNMQRDMSALKHEARNANQATQGGLELVKIEQQAMKQRMDTLETGVNALKAPVEQWVSLRKRVTAAAFLAVSVITVIWAVVSPLWSSFAQNLLHLK